MTRRIATAILLITWAALIVIGVVVYTATRHVMLTDLDESIAARASALPERLGVAATGGGHGVPEGDRYIIKNATGRTLARPTTVLAQETPTIIDRRFAKSGDGPRHRTLTLTTADDSGKPITVTYSSSAERFDHLLDRLALWLIAATLACGAVSAWAAILVSRYALKPLHRTAEQIGAIDERNLDRRIDAASLPPELTPTGERLNEMLARLESAFDQRTRFLSDASHELRTPVAALMTSIEVALRRPREAAELVETLQACLGDAKALRELVDRLMQQVRSETPALNEPPQRFDLVALLAQCADAAERASDSKAVDVRTHLPEQLSVSTQIVRVRSIVMNLLSNAIEYSHEGAHVDLSCEAGDDVVITVTDTGPGIAENLLPRLFHPFSRGSEARNAQRHFGLGLSIVQGHVRALGGRIEVESRIGRGSTFRVVLPRSITIKSDQMAAIL